MNYENKSGADNCSQDIFTRVVFLLSMNACFVLYYQDKTTRFGSTYIKIGTIQRRLAWPLCKDDTQIWGQCNLQNGN